MSPRHVDKLIKVFSHISSSCQTEAWLLQPLQIDWWRQEMCNTLQICKEFYIKGLQPRSWNNTKSLSFPSSLLLSLSCSLALLRSCAAEGDVVLLIWSLLLLLSAKKVTHKNTLTHITHTHTCTRTHAERKREIASSHQECGHVVCISLRVIKHIMSSLLYRSILWVLPTCLK